MQKASAAQRAPGGVPHLHLHYSATMPASLPETYTHHATQTCCMVHTVSKVSLLSRLMTTKDKAFH